LEFGKYSKVWEESASSRGEHNYRQIRPKGRSGPLKFHVQIAIGESIGEEKI
jgi:hypothetical protein